MSKHSLVKETDSSSKKLCLGSLDVVYNEKKGNKNVIKIAGEKFIDTEGGFLLEDRNTFNKVGEVQITLDGPLDFEEYTCLECEKMFLSSYLQKSFDHLVCDGCRDSNDKHALITRTDAKCQYLLKDCDLDKRQPILKFILRKNPHKVNWAEMKLYLHLQVEKRAIEVWGSMEGLDEAHEAKEERQIKSKAKKYNKNLKALRMEVRSSLFNKISGPNHIHEFGPEIYNESDDTYSKTCEKCQLVETFEKM